MVSNKRALGVPCLHTRTGSQALRAVLKRASTAQSLAGTVASGRGAAEDLGVALRACPTGWNVVLSLLDRPPVRSAVRTVIRRFPEGLRLVVSPSWGAVTWARDQPHP